MEGNHEPPIPGNSHIRLSCMETRKDDSNGIARYVYRTSPPYSLHTSREEQIRWHFMDKQTLYLISCSKIQSNIRENDKTVYKSRNKLVINQHIPR